MTAEHVDELIDLARAQLAHPGNWSLATDAGWLTQHYIGLGVHSRLWRAPSGTLRGSAAVRVSRPPATLLVTSMLRPGAEALWQEQRVWIDTTLQEMPDALPVQVVSESITEAEAARWQSAGYELVFEELVMERAVTIGAPADAPRWPTGATLLEWSPDAAVSSFEIYESAFRERPGFPGWTRDEWIERMTAELAFLPGASLCARIDGVAAGYVVSAPGWVDQVGVIPAFRRRGLAAALVTEALSRQRALGHETVHLHVNVNNPVGLATWRALGFAPVGRRGRFERHAIPR
jgi:mycothiol synthase